MPLTASICVPLVLLLNSFSVLGYTLLGHKNSAGTVDFKGMKLRVFQAIRTQVAEPIVQFDDSCSNFRYNWLYLRYELSLPIHVVTDTLREPLSEGKTVGNLTVDNVLLEVNSALADSQSELTAEVVGGHDRWKLVIICETFARCMGLTDELLSNPSSLEQAVRFSVEGSVGGWNVRFSANPSASPLTFRNCYRGQWITFLRRVDDNLSFKKTWDEYVKGFGNPESNYWMGLESLFQITATRVPKYVLNPPKATLCRLRIDAVDTDNSEYTAEYGLFQVMDADQNYRLRVGGEVYGSTIDNFAKYHDNQMFSTYDRDRDRNRKVSCSKAHGFVGFWFGDCESMNSIAFTYDKIRLQGGTWRRVKDITMKFKCGG